jgi:hypothetical protein
VTRESAGPLSGATAHDAVAGLAKVVVVVPVDPAVGWVVVAGEAPEDAGAAAWPAVRWAVQPVAASVATTMAAAMIRTDRIVTPLTTTTCSLDSSLG